VTIKHQNSYHILATVKVIKTPLDYIPQISNLLSIWLFRITPSSKTSTKKP